MGDDEHVDLDAMYRTGTEASNLLVAENEARAARPLDLPPAPVSPGETAGPFQAQFDHVYTADGDLICEAATSDEANRIAAALNRDATARQPGMVVDGDVLRDAVMDAVPRLLSDEAAREIAERALDGAVAAGMTVLHGADYIPRPAAASPASPDVPEGGGHYCPACARIRRPEPL